MWGGDGQGPLQGGGATRAPSTAGGSLKRRLDTVLANEIQRAAVFALLTREDGPTCATLAPCFHLDVNLMPGLSPALTFNRSNNPRKDLEDYNNVGPDVEETGNPAGNCPPSDSLLFSH